MNAILVSYNVRIKAEVIYIRFWTEFLFFPPGALMDDKISPLKGNNLRSWLSTQFRLLKCRFSF